MRTLTNTEKQAFTIIDCLSYYGIESVEILRDLLKILILSDEYEYIENKVIDMYPHLLKGKNVDDYEESMKITNYEVFKEYEKMEGC